ncbi:MAG TPA: hypothetical protein VM925_27370 [Labilithrix sp.]|jgi:hypothetical protein|nr:hypothetical protein [Labilithrix sp.]
MNKCVRWMMVMAIGCSSPLSDTASGLVLGPDGEAASPVSSADPSSTPAPDVDDALRDADDLDGGATVDAAPDLEPLSCEAGSSTSYVGEMLTRSAGYSWRDGAALKKFRGKYWLLGGWTNGPRPEWDGDDTTNEVLSSTDLVTWKVELRHVSQPSTEGRRARWTRRHTFGSVVFKDHLWVIGRDHVMTPPIGDVWRSPDGLRWEQVLAEGPWGRKRMPMITVFDGAIHVLGGELDVSGEPGVSTSTHFRSVDGLHWEQLPDMPFVRSSGAAVEQCGKLLVMGGNSGGTTVGTPRVRHNDVWAWDGKTWKRQIEHAPWPGMMWIDAVNYDGKAWILAGRSGDDDPSQEIRGAWFTEDTGRTWTYTQAPWPGSHADGVEATPEDGIVMASGAKTSTSTFRLKGVTAPDAGADASSGSGSALPALSQRRVNHTTRAP